jgi:predicted MPP superfamily phosphohydrolase
MYPRSTALATRRTLSALGPLAGAGMVLTPLLALGYAVLREPYTPVVRRRRVVLPSSWPSLSILHLSDLHVCGGAHRLLRAQTALLAGLGQPDVCVATGDLCETPDDVEATLRLLSNVRPRFGTFVVLGNHEHDVHYRASSSETIRPRWMRVLDDILGYVVREPLKEPGQAKEIARRLTGGGVEVLLNRGTRIEVSGRTVWIAGADSAWALAADMLSAMVGRRPGEPCVALAHEPELAFAAAELAADLILAGHTHGGQVRLPLLGAPITHRVDQRIQIASGMQRIGDSLLHISAGLGHSIPLRFGCPPEATWLECVPVRATDPAAAGKYSLPRSDGGPQHPVDVDRYHSRVR